MNVNIAIYLRSAFKELDAFAIPAIGTFRKLYRTSEHQQDLQEIRPPAVDIEFNQTVNNSLLLTHYLIDNVHLKKADANRIVAEISAHILKLLEEGGRFEIDQVGVLKKSYQGKIFFTPTIHSQNLLSGSYFGLQPVSYDTPEQEPAGSPETLEKMTENASPEPPTSEKRVGWKPIFLIISFLVLCTLVFINGPVDVMQRESPLARGQEPGPVDENDFITRKTKTELPDKGPYPSPKVEVEPPTPSTIDVSKASPDERFDAIAEAEVPSKDELSTTLTPEERTGLSDQHTRALGTSDEYANYRGKNDPKQSDLSNLDTVDRSLGNTRGIPSTSQVEETSLDALSQTQVSPSIYYFITGSFGTQKAARQYLHTMRGQGYGKAKILEPEVGVSLTYRVSIFDASERSKVSDFSNKLKNQKEISGWIYEHKNN